MAKLPTVKGHLILAGENLHEVKPEAGRYNSSYGIAMMAPLLEILQWPESGFFGEGQVRQILPLDATSHTLVIVTRNHAHLSIFSYAN
ncbi:MAG: hypothetical protein OXF08_11455 [Bacteroidetes bacterium]|nr:hypothetical protein [Bacteroidota bacterium]